MNLLKKNIIANFVGALWMSLMSLAFIPLYIKLLGVESWGVIGIFITLQGVMVIFDMGLSAALTRELSRLSVITGKEQEMCDVVRSMEIIYWSIAVLIGVAVSTSAHYIAYQWINPGELSPGVIENSLLIMGLAMALQWPASLYSGGLIGLQKQVSLNAINIVSSTLRNVGIILLLWLVSPTLQVFFAWQIVISALNTIILCKFLWQNMPKTKKRTIFRSQLLIGIWRFAAGMSAISILALILTQIDKIILSRALSLETYGYYTFASTIAMSLTRLFTPVFYSIYPVFIKLVATNDIEGLKLVYHKSCQFISVLIFPIAIIVALFSYEIILIWTQNPTLAEKTHLLVSILVCGTALNGIINPPYALQLAFGWTRLNILSNLFAVIILVPVTIFMTMYFGAIGAASCWLFLNIGYALFQIPIMHRRLLREEKWRWYWQDVSIPLIAGISIAVLGRLMLSGSASQLIMLPYLVIIFMLTLLVTLVSVPTIRSILYIHVLKVYYRTKVR